MGQRELRIKKGLYDRLNATAEQRGVSIKQFIEELAAMFGQSSFGIEAIANGHEQSEGAPVIKTKLIESQPKL